MNFSTLRCLAVLSFSLFLTSTGTAQPNYPKNWQDANIVHEDLDRFVKAMHQLETDADTLDVLKRFYFDKASAGLKEYVNRHGLTPQLLKDAIVKDPERYEAIPVFLDEIEDFKQKTKAAFEKFSKVVPQAVYAPTYLLVGANRGIAQASLPGQLVTIVRKVDDPDTLIKMIVHELAHFQQAMTIGGQAYGALYAQPDNMLGLCLREGGAEFVTYLVLGDVTQSKGLTYLNAHEDELKGRFLNDLEDQEPNFWLWESVGNKEYPQLLGYTMGFKVWEHYYKQTDDPKKVIDEILAMQDASEVLKKSGYLPSAN